MKKLKIRDNISIVFAKEPMLGVGFDLHGTPCYTEDNRKIRLWTIRIWFLCWIFAVNFN